MNSQPSSPSPPLSPGKTAITTAPSLQQHLQDAIIQISQLPSICGAPGIAFGVVHHGETLLVQGVGYRDVEQKLPPNGDTRFPIGSVSKSFLSAAVSIAGHEGKMDLDAPLATYLPGFAPAGDPRVGRATIRQVLQHESGIGNPQVLVCGPQAALLQPDRSFVDFINQISTSNKRGPRYGKWTYSNAGYGLVALALESLYPGRYFDFLNDRILQPLRLSQTGDAHCFGAYKEASGTTLSFGEADSLKGDSKEGRACSLGEAACDGKLDTEPQVNTKTKLTIRCDGVVDGATPKNSEKIGLLELREPVLSATHHVLEWPSAGNGGHSSTNSTHDLPDGSSHPNVAHSYGRLQNGQYHKLKEYTIDKHSTSSLAPMGLHSSVTDLLKWGMAFNTPNRQPPLSNLGTILRDTCEWTEYPEKKWFYDMGWAQVMTPTIRLGASSYNSLPCPVFDLPPHQLIIHSNGIMNGSTCAVYTFPQTQTAVVACANSASDGDGADWTAKILIQALFGFQRPRIDPPVDILALATIEAEARRAGYNSMLSQWEKGKDANPQIGSSNDFVGLYKGFGMTLLISSASSHAGNVSHENDSSAPREKLQLVFNGVERSAQDLVPYSKDTWSFFPCTRDEWIANMMIDWDFIGAGLLRFSREDNNIVSLKWEWDESENAVELWKEGTSQDSM